MALDLLFPFGILVIMVIYFIATRSKYEQKIHELYEEKFQEWKKHAPLAIEKKSHKALVGLIFKENDKISIELLEKSCKRRLEQGKFDIKEL